MLENHLVSAKPRSFRRAMRKRAIKGHKRRVKNWLRTTPLAGFEDEPTCPFRERKRHRYGDWSCSILLSWLISQVGRHWQDVLASLHEKLSARTEAGRLLLSEAESCINSGYLYHSSGSIIIDDNGILRRSQRARSSFLPWKKRIKLIAVANKWLDGRLIRRHGSKLYWLRTTVFQGAGGTIISHAQDRQLSTEEQKYFERLPLEVQNELLDRFEHSRSNRAA